MSKSNDERTGGGCISRLRNVRDEAPRVFVSFLFSLCCPSGPPWAESRIHFGEALRWSFPVSYLHNVPIDLRISIFIMSVL